MRRKLLALVGATAVALIGTVAFAAGSAQAAAPAPSIATGDKESDCLQPQGPSLAPTVEKVDFNRFIVKLPCRQVQFTDNCDGSVTVLVANTADADSPFEVRFRIGDWISHSLRGGESDTTTVAADDADDINVESRYPAEIGHYVTFAEHSWEWNASCLQITSVSNCDNTFKVSVKNTGVAAGEFSWQLGINPPTGTDIPAGATLSENFTKGDIVNIRWGKDNELVKSLEFVQPKGCVTPTPTTSAPEAPGPVLNGPDLPTTGDSLTKPAVSGIAAVALGLLILGSMWLKRRRTAAEQAAPTDEV
jgi:hypothetical protein